MSQLPTVTPSAIPAIFEYFRTNDRVFMLHGSPGTAKSATIRQSAEAFAAANDWHFHDTKTDKGDALADFTKTFGWIDTRLVEMDQVDLKGFGLTDTETGTTRFLPPDWLPQVERDGAQGILFFDELPQAPISVSNCATPLIDYGTLGDYILPEGWQIVAAGNLKTDGAGTNKIGSHLNNRLGHFEMVPDLPSWATYNLNVENGDPRVVAFLRSRPELLMALERGAIAWGSMRSWSAASQACATIADADMRQMMVSSFVGVGPAIELEGFLALIASGGEIPTWNQISTDPMGAPAPGADADQRVALNYAIIGIIANNVSDVSEMDAVVAYLNRLESDYAVCCMHDLWHRDPDLMDCTAASNWRANNPNAVIGR